jgi:zinc protease
MNSSRSPRLLLTALCAVAWILSTLLSTATAAFSVAQEPAGSVRAWEHQSSDLAVDSRIHFGHLKNGMRYAWAQNSEPKERVYVRLHVDAGSFAETDSEAGMAHFLEHMAFNGSTNFEAGTLIEWFQENGMSFGADTNAHTAFSETVYKLDLPNRDEKTIRDGLRVLRDFASELNLEEEEIQAEKGVIDGEQRERDSAGFRAFKEQLDRQYSGTLLATRMPIGTKEVRDQFNAETVGAFYRRWYRPENMTLVIVGDLGEFDVEPLIHEFFDDMKSPASDVMPEPALGKPLMEDLFFLVYNDELPAVQLTISMLKPFQLRIDTKKQRIENLPRSAAHAMLNLRMRELVKKPETSFLSAGVGNAGGMKVFEGGSLNLSAAPEKWQEALTQAYVELRKALNFGFNQAELDEIRAGLIRSLDESVQREAKAHSQALLGAVLSAVENGGVPSDAATDRETITDALNALTVEDCLKALRANWRGGQLSITGVGGLRLDDDVTELKAVYAAAKKIEIKRADAVASKAWAYASDAAKVGSVTSRKFVEDMDAVLITFANGVQLNVKKTDFKERQIGLYGRLGGGYGAIPDEQVLAASVGSMTFSAGGLAEHSADDLRRMMAGKQVGVAISVDNEGFLINGGTTAEDLLLELELLCASIESPGYRDDGINMLRAQLPLIFEQMKHTPMGPLMGEFAPELFHGNQRLDIFGFGMMPTQDALAAVDMDAVRAAIEVPMKNAPLELTIVGDLDVEAVIAAASQTVGMLPARDAAKGVSPEQKASLKSGIYMEREIATADEKITLMMIFPTTDGFDDQTRRGLNFLGQVVDDRLRLEVRERLGAAYSPGAQATSSSVFKGLGGLLIQANGDPEKLSELLDACRNVAKNLAENGVTADEVARLAEPIQNQLRDAMRTNGYWLKTLSEAQSDPSTLDSARTVLDFYANIKPEQISALAAKFLDPKNASTLIVKPKK